MVCVAAIFLAATLAGCAPPDDARAPSVDTAANIGPAADPAGSARFTAGEFIAADGARLPLRTWLPKAEVKAVIVALHGFNDYSNAFDAPAKEWAQRGIATFAYDQRGFGAAPGRYFWAGSAALAGDAATATRIARALYPARPVFLLGESMGGAIATVAATGSAGVPPASVDGVILSAPAVWGRATMELLPRLMLWAGVRFFPDVTLTGRGLGVLPSDNMPMLRALSRDPMVIKETRVDTIYGLVNLMDLAIASASRLEAPTLLMYGANDQLVPASAVRAFVADLPPDQARRLAFYQHGYHMLLRDLEGPVVNRDVATWTLDRNAPLPSQADRIQSASPWPPTREGAG